MEAHLTRLQNNWEFMSLFWFQGNAIHLKFSVQKLCANNEFFRNRRVSWFFWKLKIFFISQLNCETPAFFAEACWNTKLFLRCCKTIFSAILIQICFDMMHCMLSNKNRGTFSATQRVIWPFFWSKLLWSIATVAINYQKNSVGWVLLFFLGVIAVKNPQLSSK